MTPLERVIAALRHRGSRPGGGGLWSCPAHADRNPSLSVRECADGAVAMKCFVGCSTKAVVSALGLTLGELFPAGPRQGEGVGSTPPRNGSTGQQSRGAGITLAEYAAAKQLPEAFLHELGLREIRYGDAPAIRIPYFLEDGSAGPVRFRVRLEKGREVDARFKWKTGSKPIPYGLWRIGLARAAGYIVLVEGESDCHTAWRHGIPALGLPGAASWRDDWAPHLDGITKIYACIEPDKAGASLRQRLSQSSLRERLSFLSLGESKDPSGLYLANPDSFRASFDAAMAKAVSATDAERTELQVKACAGWERCAAIAREPRILACFAQRLRAHGCVGEERLGRLVYLVTTSRFLQHPVSIAVKGESSGGKSFTTEKTLRFFPRTAYYPLTAMSERALAYSEEPLSHRMLVIYEGAGLEGDFASYLLRSLLSEGHIRYETVEKTVDGMRARLIDRPGPTGLIVTTTRLRLHPENETRLLSVPIDDTPAQTQRVFDAIANPTGNEPDLAEWWALQDWLATGEHRVVIPYAQTLAGLVPPVAVRLRRDFGLFLNLVRAHALLHQAARDRDDAGQVVASLDDYAAVHELVVDLLGEAVQATVPGTVRETVGAVREILVGATEVSVTALANHLHVDKGAASRRWRAAAELGYLVNHEDRKGRPARLALGEPLPVDRQLLPSPAALRVLTCCAVDGGDKEAPPWEEGDGEEVAQAELDLGNAGTGAPELAGVDPVNLELMNNSITPTIAAYTACEQLGCPMPTDEQIARCKATGGAIGGANSGNGSGYLAWTRADWDSFEGHAERLEDKEGLARDAAEERARFLVAEEHKARAATGEPPA